MTSLRKNFPGLAVIGEEKEEEVEKDVPADWLVSEEDAEASGLAVPDEYKGCAVEQFTVWVDPLDGTKEYTEGFLDHVTVLIGIAVGKRAVAGVINQPFFNYERKGEAGAAMGRTLYGIVGSGVRGIEKTPPPAGQRILTTTRSHGTGLINDTAQACKPTDIIRVGGAGHKVRARTSIKETKKIKKEQLWEKNNRIYVNQGSYKIFVPVLGLLI